MLDRLDDSIRLEESANLFFSKSKSKIGDFSLQSAFDWLVVKSNFDFLAVVRVLDSVRNQIDQNLLKSSFVSNQSLWQNRETAHFQSQVLVFQSQNHHFLDFQNRFTDVELAFLLRKEVVFEFGAVQPIHHLEHKHVRCGLNSFQNPLLRSRSGGHELRDKVGNQLKSVFGFVLHVGELTFDVDSQLALLFKL